MDRNRRYYNDNESGYIKFTQQQYQGVEELTNQYNPHNNTTHIGFGYTYIPELKDLSMILINNNITWIIMLQCIMLFQ